MASESYAAVANVRAALLWPTTYKGSIAVVIMDEVYLCLGKIG